MSELEKLVAAEVAKQLGAIPYVKRAKVTAEQWRALILRELWALVLDSVEPRLDKNGLAWYRIPREDTDELPYQIDQGLVRDAAHNVTAPAKFGNELIFIDNSELFEYKVGYSRLK